MAYHADTHHVSPLSLPAIRHVESDRPWLWLAAGWNDFTRTPAASMGYGVLVTAMMLLVFYLLQSIRSFHLAVGLMAGFVFLGPVLAVGLYELSRRMDHGKPAQLVDSWHGWRRNTGSVLALGVILVLLMMVWFMLSMQLMALLYQMTGEISAVFGMAGSWQEFAFSLRWPAVIAFTSIGVIAVAVAYLLAVMAVPMLTEHEDMDVITAMVVSVNTVRRNPAAMILWAALIALFTGVAVMPVFLGLIVVFPLLAFASWHAYRDVIEHK
jgi:uncharacterized membrane protein